MDKLLTIVIPTYNMQDYLRKCLDSLIVEESKMQLMEVLVINDGSKDSSSAIAHEYESRFPETFRVIDKENGNYGSCVNCGLYEARGRYIKILDSDDWFDSVELSGYVQFLSGLDCGIDLILTDFQIVNLEGAVVQSKSYDFIEKSKPFCFQECEETRAVFDMHSFTYRTGFLKGIGYKQTEGISYTDVEWVYLPMAFVGTSIYAPYNIYRYLAGRDGQTMAPRAISKTINDHMVVSCNLIAYYDTLDIVSNKTALRVDSEVDYLSRIIYKSCLLEQNRKDFSATRLKAYDAFLLEHRPKIFNSIEKRLKPNGIPLRYVRFWHIAGFRFPLGTIRDIVRRIRY